MTALTPLKNRFATPADHWVQLVPRGEWPHVDEKGVRRMQIVDDAALDSMVRAFREKVLIDQEHWSYDRGGSSEAFGWVAQVEKRTDGLWGRVEWTDLGTAAIENRRYRYLSPAWTKVARLDDQRVRPLALDTVGLTNTPNLRGMIPLTNRETRPDAGSGQHQQNPQYRTMKNISIKLGLSADASEESVLAEVTKLLNRATGAETQLTALTSEVTTLRNRVTAQDSEIITAELEARGVDATKQAKLLPVLSAMKNREERIGFLEEVLGATIPASGAEATATPATTATGTLSGRPIVNRSASGAPNPATPGKAPGTAVDPQQRARQANAAVEEFRLANKCTYDAAWNAVRSRKPELFA